MTHKPTDPNGNEPLGPDELEKQLRRLERWQWLRRLFKVSESSQTEEEIAKPWETERPDNPPPKRRHR